MRKLKFEQTGPRPYLQQDVQVVIVPAPTGGWNAIDPLALMEPRYAPIMDNWVPRTGWVEVRPGYSAWAQNLSSLSAVESLMTYRFATGEKLFAASNGSIFDVSNQGISTSVQSGLQNNRWQYINYTPSLGANYIYIVNGQDAPRYYNGTTWTQPTITGTTNPPSTFTNIASWKRRIWFVEGNSTIAAFMPADAITGAVAGELDLGALIMKGGHLVAIGTITVDGGNGPDDLLVFIGSRGECAVYQGTDPTSNTAFGLVGVWQLPPPLGNRCTMDYGSDLALITLQGVIPFSQVMSVSTDAVRGIALTNKIQDAMLQSAAMGQNNFGWELSHFPAQGLFILNVPVSQDSNQIQYAMNALTGAWCRFVGWNANCFAIYNDNLYFGDDKGNVNLAWSGAADLVTPIVSDMQCAFNYFGEPGKLKRVTMIQPFLTTSGALTPTLAIDTDFGSVSPTSTVTTATATGATFGSGIFGTATFAAGTSTQTIWQGTQAQGHALAVRMKVNLLPAGAGGQSVFDTGVFDTMVFDGFGTATNTLQVNAWNTMLVFGGTI